MTNKGFHAEILERQMSLKVLVVHAALREKKSEAFRAAVAENREQLNQRVSTLLPYLKTFSYAQCLQSKFLAESVRCVLICYIDTIENIDLAQEKVITTQYGQIKHKGKIFFFNKTPNNEGKMYIGERVFNPKDVYDVLSTANTIEQIKTILNGI